MVYKTDLENAGVAVIREAMPGPQTPSRPWFYGMLNSAGPEHYAVRQSLSNSRAKRAVQRIEHLSRNHLSAIESRIGSKISSSHRIC